MIRAVVFDFDGTLVDSNAIKAQAFDDVVAHLPGGADALAQALRGGGDRYRIFDEVARRLGDGVVNAGTTGHALAAEYSRRCRIGIACARERRGAVTALRRLRARGLRLYINTATPRGEMLVLLRVRGWSALFDGVCGAPQGKSENLRAILRRERIQSRALMMIGDSADDQMAARDVGAWFVGVTAERRIVMRPPFGMRDLVGLPALLNRLAPRKRPAGVSRGRSSA